MKNKAFDIPDFITKLKQNDVKFVLSIPTTHQEGFKVSNHFEVSKFANSRKVNYIQT